VGVVSAESALWLQLVVFAASAGGVWWGGKGLSERADVIARRLGLGGVFAGAVLLGVATSLPEIATSVSAAGSGAGTLAGNNLLGGVAMQIAVLAIVDMVALRGRALTAFSPDASLLLHGVLLILLLAVAAAAIVAPDVAVGGRLSPWSLALAGLYGVGILALRRYEGDPRWEPRGPAREPPVSAVDMRDGVEERLGGASTSRLGLQFVAFALVVLVGGHLVATTGETLAERTGLGETFVGATLVAIATSLPEVSTTYSAIRFGAYGMALGNIMGTNALEVALFLPADLAYDDGSVFAALDEASVLLALVGIVASTLYLWGALERRDRTVASAGIDSAAVLVVYAVGMSLFAVMS